MVEQARRPFIGIFLRPDDCTFTAEECDDLTAEQLTAELAEQAHKVYDAKEQALTSPIMRELERVILLKNVDSKWMDHIDAMTELRNGIGLRAYGQHDPVVEYKREGFDMFDAMIDSIREDTVRMIFLAQVRTREEPKREQVAKGDRRRRRVRRFGRTDPEACRQQAGRTIRARAAAAKVQKVLLPQAG